MTYPADFHQFFGREEGEDPQGNALWQLCDEVYVLFQLKRNEINSDTWRKMNTVFRIFKKRKEKKKKKRIQALVRLGRTSADTKKTVPVKVILSTRHRMCASYDSKKQNMKCHAAMAAHSL